MSDLQLELLRNALGAYYKVIEDLHDVDSCFCYGVKNEFFTMICELETLLHVELTQKL